MSWLDNFVRPKIQALVNRRQTPENLWGKCGSCEQMIFHRELEARLQVCPHCGHHMRLSLEKRFEALFDDGAYTRIELPDVVPDPLRFRDTKRYADRLKEAQNKTGHKDAAMVVHGTLGGRQVVACGLSFAFMGGSMGLAVGEAVVRAARLAVLQSAPLIMFTASGGARMQEGILSLMQMPRTTIAVDMVREARLPYIVVLTNPTTGGVTASFAMLGDIAIAEPGALIGFAGPRVIQDTIRESLPPDFQTAEYLRDHGMVDMVVPRDRIRETLVTVLDLFLSRQPSADVVDLVDASLAIPEAQPAAPAAEGEAAETAAEDAPEQADQGARD